MATSSPWALGFVALLLEPHCSLLHPRMLSGLSSAVRRMTASPSGRGGLCPGVVCQFPGSAPGRGQAGCPGPDPGSAGSPGILCRPLDGLKPSRGACSFMASPWFLLYPTLPPAVLPANAERRRPGAACRSPQHRDSRKQWGNRRRRDARADEGGRPQDGIRMCAAQNGRQPWRWRWRLALRAGAGAGARAGARAGAGAGAGAGAANFRRGWGDSGATTVRSSECREAKMQPPPGSNRGKSTGRERPRQ